MDVALSPCSLISVDGMVFIESGGMDISFSSSRRKSELSSGLWNIISELNNKFEFSVEFVAAFA